MLSMRLSTVTILSIVLFLGGSSVGQESRSEIGLQGTGFFTKDTTGQGTTQRNTNTGGFLVGYRYSFNRWLAAEAAMAMTGTPSNTLPPRDCRGSKPTFTRQLAASSFAYRHLRDSG
jgi:hypothetical protein